MNYSYHSSQFVSVFVEFPDRLFLKKNHILEFDIKTNSTVDSPKTDCFGLELSACCSVFLFVLMCYSHQCISFILKSPEVGIKHGVCPLTAVNKSWTTDNHAFGSGYLSSL